MSANSHLNDLTIRHAIFLHRYGRGLEADFVKLLDASTKDMVERLAARLALIEERGYDLGPASTKRLNEALEELRAINEGVYSNVQETLTKQLGALAVSEAAFQTKALNSAITINFAAKTPAPHLLKSIVTERPMEGKFLKPWVADMAAGNIGRIEQAIQLGMVAGESSDKIVRRIVGTKAEGYKNGVAHTSRRAARSMVRTSVTQISNQAAQETWKANESVIKGYRWVSALDTRTTLICAERDGKVFKLGEGPVPPAHVACRSMTVAVTKSFAELGLDREEYTPPQRASMDGQVSAGDNFEAWLGKQSAERQDEVLGAKRGELFRSGRYKLRDFLDDRGGAITLADLDATHPVTKAAPAPAPAPVPRDFSPINPAITADAIRVTSKREAVKTLTTTVAAGARDPRYSPTPEFRNAKVNQFGKVALSANFTDDTASMLAALQDEINTLTDAFGVPRLRGIKTTSSAIGSMGDGLLSLNPGYFNGFAREVGGGNIADKLIEDHRKMQAQLVALKKALDEESALLKAMPIGADREAATFKFFDKVDAFNAQRKEFIKLDKQVLAYRRGGATEAKKVNQWKPGDPPSARPFNAIDYFAEGIDKARMVLFHEASHHVHQMWNKQGPRLQVGSPPLEQRLRSMFRELKNYDNLPSSYSKTNAHEWWAESFGLFMMGRRDLADPRIVELIEELLNEVKKNGRS